MYRFDSTGYISSLVVSGDSMNEFLNDNWEKLADEIKPILEKTISDLFKKLSNKIYSKYPLNELLPP